MCGSVWQRLWASACFGFTKDIASMGFCTAVFFLLQQIPLLCRMVRRKMNANLLFVRTQSDISAAGKFTEAMPETKAFLDAVAETWIENNYTHSGNYYYVDGEMVAEPEKSTQQVLQGNK